MSRKHYIIILSLFQITQNRWFRNSFLEKKRWGRVFFSSQKRRGHFVPRFLKNGQNVYWKQGVRSNTEVNPSYENISWCFLQSILLIIDKNNTVSCVSFIFWEHTVISRICNKFFVSYSLTYVLFKLSLSIPKTVFLISISCCNKSIIVWVKISSQKLDLFCSFWGTNQSENRHLEKAKREQLPCFHCVVFVFCFVFC